MDHHNNGQVRQDKSLTKDPSCCSCRCGIRNHLSAIGSLKQRCWLECKHRKRHKSCVEEHVYMLKCLCVLETFAHSLLMFLLASTYLFPVVFSGMKALREPLIEKCCHQVCSGFFIQSQTSFSKVVQPLFSDYIKKNWTQKPVKTNARKILDPL